MATLFRHSTEQVLTPESLEETRQLAKVLTVAQGVEIMTDDGVTTLSADLVQQLTKLVRTLAEGRAVTIGAAPAEVTTSTAAQLLGVSRPTVMKMISTGELKSHMVGSHHRLTTSDVMAVLRAKRVKQREAVEAMRQLEDELGL